MTIPSKRVVFYSISVWFVYSLCAKYLLIDAFAPSNPSWTRRTQLSGNRKTRNRRNQVNHIPRRPLSSSLALALSSTSSSSSSLSSSSSSTTTSSLPPAFVIEKISTWSPPPSELAFRKIAKMCIPVFFDEQNNTNKGPGWLRQYKLNYLINLQSADLRVRRNWYPDTNEMFVAYEVVLADEDEYLFLDSNSKTMMDSTTNGNTNPKQILSTWKRIRKRSSKSSSGKNNKALKPLILDVDQIYNLSSLRQKQKEVGKQRKRMISSLNVDDGGGDDVTAAAKRKKAEMLKRLSSVAVDMDNNNNNKDISSTDNFVKGDIIGFVEITKKPYGLGSATATDSAAASDNDDDLFVRNDHEKQETGDEKNNNNSKKKKKTKGATVMNIRPVLTNLAVAKRARKYGIGSKLVDQCEECVRNVWKMNELVLEVEDYNEAALNFYTKRGFKVMYSDPASRRYDLSGFFPEKVRCRRDILRKVYSPTQNLFDSGSNVLQMSGFFTRIQELVDKI
mmetsp:Transcript_27300/g.65425  ORF Transcript_27300/g.65425 Transcript_27300/m.65425 type:complete len:505 (+) Transcript_27300:114-1628(+)